MHPKNRVAIMPDRSDKELSKVEKDVLDILKDVELPDERRERPGNVIDFKRRKKRPKRPQIPTSRPQRSDFKRHLGRLTPAKMLAGTVIFALGAVFLQSVSGSLSMILVVAAIASFLGLFIVRSGGSGLGSTPSQPRVKRWRGRDIELEPTDRHASGESSWKRFLPGKRR